MPTIQVKPTKTIWSVFSDFSTASMDPEGYEAAAWTALAAFIATMLVIVAIFIWQPLINLVVFPIGTYYGLL